jgi:uncharacterized RDD family membrane protein YckC
MAPAGWYADPAGSGGQRYWSGTAWTEYTVPWPPAPAGGSGIGAAPWKGARYGRPAAGPGSLADPARRLAARLLDGLVFTPVFVVLSIVAIVIVAPHAGPIFPDDTRRADAPPPGLLWLYLAVFVAALVGGVLFALYEAIATARYGRTLGKAWLRIRPVTLDGRRLDTGCAFARAGLHWLANLLGWIGALDELWCVWDVDRQCLHDKVAGTLVVND